MVFTTKDWCSFAACTLPPESACSGFVMFRLFCSRLSKVRVSAYPVSTRPLTCRAVRRGSPSCRSCYRSVIRLISLLGYSGERPRFAAHLQMPAELSQAVAAAFEAFGNSVPVFPSCQNIIVLAGGVVLPPPRAASGACLRCFCTAFPLSFSTCSVNVLLHHPHAGFGAYQRAAQKARRKKG